MPLCSRGRTRGFGKDRLLQLSSIRTGGDERVGVKSELGLRGGDPNALGIEALPVPVSSSHFLWASFSPNQRF